MFVLTTISDVIPILPSEFRKSSAHAIQDNIHNKYSNKVVQNVGLCICLWDLLKASEGMITGGDSRVHVNVVFRLVVFRPFKGEILQGTICDDNEDGIRLHLDFFEDIWVPKNLLFEGAYYAVPEPPEDLSQEQRANWPKRKEWIWKPNDEEYAFSLNERIRFRVEAEIWHDHTPQKLIMGDNGKLMMPSSKDREVPYTIIASMAMNEMGPLFWWEDRSEEDS